MGYYYKYRQTLVLLKNKYPENLFFCRKKIKKYNYLFEENIPLIKKTKKNIAFSKLQRYLTDVCQKQHIGPLYIWRLYCNNDIFLGGPFGFLQRRSAETILLNCFSANKNLPLWRAPTGGNTGVYTAPGTPPRGSRLLRHKSKKPHPPEGAPGGAPPSAPFGGPFGTQLSSHNSPPKLRFIYDELPEGPVQLKKHYYTPEYIRPVRSHLPLFSGNKKILLLYTFDHLYSKLLFHAAGYKRVSNFFEKIREKKKLKILYGRQSSKYLQKQYKGLYNFLFQREAAQIFSFEYNINFLLCRCGFYSNIRKAEQMIKHGHHFLNNKKIHSAISQIKRGDVIGMKKRSFNQTVQKPLSEVSKNKLYENPHGFLYKKLSIITHKLKYRFFFTELLLNQPKTYYILQKLK